MSTFAQTVTQWHDFYIMVGTAGATLVGLLFIGLTLNIELIRRADFADLRTLAALTFNSFFYAIVFAVIFLIPDQVPIGLGLPLLAIGGLGWLNVMFQYRRTRKSHRAWGRSTVTNRFFIPSVALLAVIVIAVSVMAGSTSGFYWLVPAMILLLASGSRNAWDLLIGLRGPEDQSTGSPRK
jgi:hypothetical protein